jgi:hypothetical protein
MALADKLAQPPKRMHGLPCSVAVLLQRLETHPAELDAFQAMLANPSWSATAIHKAVAEEGYEVGIQTIGRHRTQSCRCFGTLA